jgi:hypothetical protein
MTKKLIGTLVAECQDNLLRRGEIRLSPRAYDIHGKIGHVRYQDRRCCDYLSLQFCHFYDVDGLGPLMLE